jgi:hypothetical protein
LRVWSLGFWLLGFGSRVLGLGFRVLGFGCMGQTFGAAGLGAAGLGAAGWFRGQGVGFRFNKAATHPNPGYRPQARGSDLGFGSGV